MITPGVRYMLFATFCFATMNVFVKLLGNIGAVEIVFFRSITSLIISYLFLKRANVSVWGNNKIPLMLRGLSGAIALILFFVTIHNIPLASAVTFQFTSPIFTAILGIYIAKEKVHPLQWLFFAMAFGGIILIQGFDTRVSTLYISMGLLSALFAGVAYNIIRTLKTSEHPLVIVFYFPLATLPITGIYLLFDFTMPVGVEWLYLLIVGLLTQAAQYYMTKSYQSEELSKVASLNYLGILYALGYGWVLFEEHFNLMTYVGMSIVLSGVILNIWFKHYTTARKLVN
ncbi:MAG: DMT family transporter [Bacteroidota bacterium]